MTREKIHKNICGQATRLTDWYCDKVSKLNYPIYSSYDIRDAGFKVSNVDANIYPAGFSNICPTDKEHAVPLMNSYLSRHYSNKSGKILLLTEEHTKNPYYWDNVLTIKSLIEATQREVLIGFPSRLEAPLDLQSATGQIAHVVSGFPDSPEVKAFKPDLIISNNDFSEAREEWGEAWQAFPQVAINPPRELGWYQRKKSRYFKLYNQLVEEFSQLTGADPFLMNVRTEFFEDFDLASDDSRNLLAEKVDAMIAELREDYKKRGIQSEPFLFVKNNSGTYGLAVVRVGSGQEVKEWSYKSRKKMKAAKGGRDVEEVIIQEGIPSRVQSDGASAEPVIYMIGSELAGGFLRTHSEKGATDSLNSPGAVYKKLCVSDLQVSLEGNPLENVYGWSARLGMLAIAMEAKEMNVDFNGYTQKSCDDETEVLGSRK